VSAQDDGVVSFAVASDLHYVQPTEEIEDNIDDPIFYYANRRAQMEHESGFIIDEFLRQCAENDDCEFVSRQPVNQILAELCTSSGQSGLTLSKAP
jgi:hypothetical protein